MSESLITKPFDEKEYKRFKFRADQSETVTYDGPLVYGLKTFICLWQNTYINSDGADCFMEMSFVDINLGRHVNITREVKESCWSQPKFLSQLEREQTYIYWLDHTEATLQARLNRDMGSYARILSHCITHYKDAASFKKLPPGLQSLVRKAWNLRYNEFKAGNGIWNARQVINAMGLPEKICTTPVRMGEQRIAFK